MLVALKIQEGKETEFIAVMSGFHPDKYRSMSTADRFCTLVYAWRTRVSSVSGAAALYSLMSVDENEGLSDPPWLYESRADGNV